MTAPAARLPLARTVLTLVRHGQTSANLDGVWHGSSDTPLTPHGELQAARVAHFLGDHSADATVVYTSPLQRARRTARPIAERLGLELRVDDDLREYDIGAWEGMSFRELHEVHGLWHHIATDPDYAPHGGESPRQVVLRLTRCLQRIAAAHPRERVIAVAHGGALSLALSALLDPDRRAASDAMGSRVMKNCAVSELALEPAPELLSFNLEAHLAGL
jgi:broad specificity phosphatase PhoE